MATYLQKKTLERVVELGGQGKRIVKGRVLRDVGASKTVIKTPSKVFESKGFLELCDELGLTDTFLTEALVADIKAKPKKREKELRLAFTVRGRLKEEKPDAPQINIAIFDPEQLRRIADRTSRELNGRTESERTPD